MRCSIWVVVFLTFAAAWFASPGSAQDAGVSPGVRSDIPLSPVSPQVSEGPVAAKGTDSEPTLSVVGRLVDVMDALERQVESVRSSEPELSQRRVEVENLLDQSDKVVGSLQPQIEAARKQLEQLGARPKDKDAVEPQQIISERARLAAAVAALEGGAKTADLVKVRARQLSAKIQELRHGLFADRLLQRTQSPLLPGIWQDLKSHLGQARIDVLSVFGTWHTILTERQQMALTVAGLAIGVYALLRLLLSRTLQRVWVPQGPLPAGYMRRASVACLAAPLMALPGVAAALVLYLGLQSSGLVYSRIEEWLQGLLQAALIVIVVASIATAILEPRRPDWRLVNLANRPARLLWKTAFGFALVYAVDIMAQETIRLLVLPLPFSVALSFLTSLGFAVLLLIAAAIPADKSPASSETSRTVPVPAPNQSDDGAALDLGQLRVPLVLVAIFILVASCAGYVALGRFAAGQIVITGSAVVLALLLHLGIQSMETGFISSEFKSGIGAWLMQHLGYDVGQRRIIGRALSVILHLGLVLGLVPSLLLAWGFSVADVLSGVKSALFGFEIGSWRISLAQILLGFALFAGIVLFTRIIQRWLRTSVLRPDRIDPGLGNSIHQGLGYTGVSLAILAGISFVGIDITNLAIVAGALSVGIGFGLQSIVNNFVSGLILLVERPIKVGDWIVVKGGEGFVRAISVRSTEIETFDRASLIVPNSELISNVVTNWTHRNALGRIVIKVNASYKSDPDHVLRVLTDVATASPLVMKQPPPSVSLDNLGPDALEFSIRVLVADISKALGVQTQLRTAVFHAFREFGIEFPTAERDIYLRDLDGVKVMIARIIEERARGKASDFAGSPGGGGGHVKSTA